MQFSHTQPSPVLSSNLQMTPPLFWYFRYRKICCLRLTRCVLSRESDGSAVFGVTDASLLFKEVALCVVTCVRSIIKTESPDCSLIGCLQILIKRAARYTFTEELVNKYTRKGGTHSSVYCRKFGVAALFFLLRARVCSSKWK